MRLKGSTYLVTAALSCLAIIPFVCFVAVYRAKTIIPPSAINRLEPIDGLDKASQLAWLGNWEASRDLFAKAEVASRKDKDLGRQIFAHVGYLRATIERRPYHSVSEEINHLLRLPGVQKDQRLRLWCLSVKGYADLNTDIRLADKTWTEAHELAVSLKERDWAARSLGELGIIDYLSGNRQRAVLRIGQALMSARKYHDVDAEVRYLSMLGDGFIEEKRYWFAKIFLQHAIQVAEQTPNAGFPYLAYQGQAAAMLGIGEYQDAKKLLETSLRKSRAEQRPGQEALSLLLLGNYEKKVGEGHEAEDKWRAAITIFRSLGAFRPLSETLFNLAGLQRSRGDFVGARISLENGVRASRRVGDFIYYPRDLTNLAEIAVLRCDFHRADKLFRKAEDMFEMLSSKMNTSFGRAGVTAARSEAYLEHFSLLNKLGDTAGALHVIERVRSSTTEERRRWSVSDTVSTQLSTLERGVAAIQLAMLRANSPEEKATLTTELAEQERQLAFVENQTEFSLRRAHPPASLRQIQKSLRQDEVLAEYVVLDLESYCIAVTKDSIRILALGEGRLNLEAAIRAQLATIIEKKPGAAEAHHLYDLLLKPIERFHKARLIVSPDGSLHHLPFDALIDDVGNYALTRMVISYIDSGSELQRLRRQALHTANQPLLAVGGVSYDYLRLANDRAEVKPRSLANFVTRGFSELTESGLPELPHSEEEVQAIGNIIGPGAIVLDGKHASEKEFKAQPLTSFRIIHFAVHSFSDLHYPERAALVLGTRSGDPDDGLLQAREIVQLPLEAELVTLSGCSTGIGTLREEAGVESIENAFILAGAHAVVASFWDIQDHSTTTFMKLFYSRLAAGNDKAYALTQAKRDFIAQYGSLPYYWAGFFINGDASTPIMTEQRKPQ